MYPLFLDVTFIMKSLSKELVSEVKVACMWNQTNNFDRNDRIDTKGVLLRQVEASKC